MGVTYTLEMIGMVVMIAIILIVVIIYVLLPFISVKTSADFYNSFTSSAQSACTAPQTMSNINFNTPTALIFQIYDSPSCNQVLSANPSIFSNSTPVSTNLENNYDLCYATVSNPSGLGISSGNQYYYSQKISGVSYFVLGPNNPPTAELSASSPINKLAVPAIEANTSSGSLSLVLVSATPINVTQYTFSLIQYANSSSEVNVYFNGLASCERSYSITSQFYSSSITSPCEANVSNVTVQVIPDSVNGVVPAVEYQINFSADPISSVSSGLSILSQQCSNIIPAVKSGYIKNGSIMCAPIICGGSTFPISNSNQDPLLAIYGGSFTSLELTSGVSSILFINANPEQEIPNPIIK